MMIQDFNIKVNVMPWHDYICHAHHEHGNLAKIVHFGCHDKVWTDDRYLRTYPEWFRTHMQWPLHVRSEPFRIRTKIAVVGPYFVVATEVDDLGEIAVLVMCVTDVVVPRHDVDLDVEVLNHH